MTSPTDLAYLAGFIDGEGCIECRFLSAPSKCRGLSLLIAVGQTDIRVHRWLLDTFGGREYIYNRAPHKTLYRWTLPIRSNMDLCLTLQPLLKIKGEQLALAIEAAGLSITRGSGRTIPEANMNRRTEIVREVARLKRG